MDMLVVIIMLVLFFFLMVFVFSTALLTPLIGKRNLIFVLSLGFIVGLVGGAFFIAPLYNDIPDMARSIYTFTSGSAEVINVNMSTDSDIVGFIDTTKKLNGVKSVQTNRITVRTASFDGEWKQSLESRIPDVDPGIKSAEVIPNETIVLTLKNDSNPSQVVKKLDDWLILVSSIDVIGNIAEISITVDPSQVEAVSAKLPQDQMVITNITGSVEDQINSLKKNIPDRNSIILLCGLIGMFTGFAGLFIDSIAQIWDKTRNWLAERKRKR